MNYIINNKYIILIVVFTFISRAIYHTNAPFFEDEGLFLLDSSKNFTDLYVNTLYMKPFFGAYYYHLIFTFFGENSFLALHISTTIFIIITNVFLFLIIKTYTQNDFVSLTAPLLFLTFTNLSVGGYAHSSLEYFQLVFLMGAYFFIFIKPVQKIGLAILSFAIMIKQNAALIVFALLKDILKEWRLALLVIALWSLIIIIFFNNFFFNNLIFPSQFYNAAPLSDKLFYFYIFFLKAGYGFASLILFGAILSFILFYKNYKKEFLFVILLAFSLVSTPLFPQHFIAIFPFLIIIFSIGFGHLFTQSFSKLHQVVWGGVILLLIFNTIKIFKNHTFASDENSLTMTQTINGIGRLNGNKSGIIELLNYFKTIKNQKVYIYPILFPHPYITYNFSTIDKFYSNDHIEIILKNEFLRNKLFDSIKTSKPTYLIRMRSSEMDDYMYDILKSYSISEQFGDIKIYIIKE
jgi:hypothetical protein